MESPRIYVEILKALKMIIGTGMEKSEKILENCDADLENADVYCTVDYPCVCQFSCSS